MRRKPLTSRLLGVLRGLLCLSLLLATACGGAPDGLVVVRVSGLLSTITALSVTVTLDNVVAKNPQPQTQPGASETKFLIFDDMQRFGVQVPSGTQMLKLDVIGYNTNLEVVRSGTGTLPDVTQSRELAVTLQ